MHFNSIEFLVFLPLAFVLYWLVFRERKIQNFLLLVLSYFFYGLWDWRFLSLILLSTIVDFSVGQLMEKSSGSQERKLYLSLSLIVNLGLLFYYKYSNFFLDSFCDFITYFNLECSISSLSIILPVGISFYTFQTLSYSIDVYKKKIKAESNFVTFAAYVAFFPQLVAGPIERASNLLPQFNSNRKFDYDLAVNGLRQILWGLFKKVVIADNCSIIVDLIFSNPGSQDSIVLFFGSVFFAFQIYCDFSGYSDIAIGIGKLLGIKLMVNFRYPYFSRDIAEFWRRWHISLSTWFRDYVYIPLGGSRVSRSKGLRNIFAIFLISGFWHGANWTFVLWGFINALYFVPQYLRNTNRTYVSDNVETLNLKTCIAIGSTFILTCLAWIFFRVESLSAAVTYMEGIFTYPFVDLDNKFYSDISTYVTLFFIMLLFSIEWKFRRLEYPLFSFEIVVNSKYIRLCIYSFLALLVYYYIGRDSTFIYFQF